MKQWLGRIGGGGIAAMAAVALAAGLITYRLLDDGEEPPPVAEAADALTALERRAAAAPGDPAAWQELGFAYFERGRYADAATAYTRATEADPESAVLWSSLGEALVMASERDPMPPRALDSFRKSASLDPQDPRARYFLAVNRDLGGDHAGAIADWLSLLADTPAGAPWENDLRRTIEQVGAINRIEVARRIADTVAARPAAPLPSAAAGAAMAGIPGPTREQMAAASALRPSEQQDMAEGMVARLAARLESDPRDPDGWVMLMRSYQTLGRGADARAALTSAVAANPAQRTMLESAAESLGVR